MSASSSPPIQDFSLWAPSLDAYARWFDRECPEAARKWALDLTRGSADQVEAAIAEAIAWDWLSHRAVVHSAFRPDRKSPDFECSANGKLFFVEIKNISKAAMTAQTGMPDAAPFSGFYRSPADRLHGEILGSLGQGLQLGCSYVVIVSTLHGNAARLLADRHVVESVLHSQEFLSAPYDSRLGVEIGRLGSVVDFRRAAFTQSRTFNPKRQRISGALFGPFGRYPNVKNLLGIINPTAEFPLNPIPLADAVVASFGTWPPQDEVALRWSDGAT